MGEYIPKSVDVVRFRIDFVRFVKSFGVVDPLVEEVLVGEDDSISSLIHPGRSSLDSGAMLSEAVLVRGVSSKGRLGLGR